LPFVVEGSTRVRLPGAPGCTTTGFAGAGCCAQTRKGDKAVRTLAAASRHAPVATLAATRISQVRLTERGVMWCKYLITFYLQFTSVFGNPTLFKTSRAYEYL
jgi:hypothetical protein